ncbi:cytochrome P450 [Actinosynnema sp. NPDC047251]|uniref:Cytochrome P450 family protein n=1 Tax=Saccharothrix espanaensis (strain ATCC 51144 / DSM 44229 / JCM 9112 / NBRC 15066 / NRRL 15764) TaxID=1179773 RepID=K0JWR2_SACES|nr:cytochrome P450 [Saccharothrix espanaensis]CCH32300.1 Cytochrome P450 family protein [Saccharothrix espanaensis DSM 44229]
MITPAQLPFAQADVLQLAPGLRALQARGAVHRVRTPGGDEAWLVTGHARVRQLLDDDRLSRTNPDPEAAAKDSGSALLAGLLGGFATDHARLRALLEPHFAPERMAALRTCVDKLAGQLLDELAGRKSPVDLRRALALPLPIQVMCEWLGVPQEDKDRFGGWTRDAATIGDPVRSKQGVGALLGYCRQLIAGKRRDPADDVISRICATEKIEDDEILGLTALLLFGGYETTVARIGTCVLLLLADPEQWQALLDDPTLVPGAVEETLRLSMPNPHNGGMPRHAVTDFEIDGVTIRAGDFVLLNIIAANHDETAFADPGGVDVTRDTAGSLAFGYGAHHCVGAALARMQLQVVLTQLLARFPTLRLAVGVDELELRHDTLIGGLVRLPVTW